MKVLNEFTGFSDWALEQRLHQLFGVLDEIDKDEEGSGGGSPREGILDRIDAVLAELKRRNGEKQ